MAVKDEVTFELPEYEAHKKQVELCNIVYAGIDQAKKLITPTPNENPTDFAIRVEKATLDNYVERITTTMSGQIFRKPLSFEDIPEKITKHFKKISGKKDVNQFGKQLVENAIRDGKAYILVDMPKNGGDPYFSHVERSQLINWRKDEEGRFTFAVIVESYQESVGKFAVEKKLQYRVIDENGNVTIYRQDNNQKNKDVWITTEIPTDYDFCPLYELSISETPPLYDIAKININYLNAFSKKDQYLDTAGSPIPFGKALGLNGDNQVLGNDEAPDQPKIVLGVNSIVLADDPEASLEWVEMSGGSIEALQDDLERKARSMAERAIKLVEDSQNVKTATQTESENSESSSRLTDIAEDTEHALNEAYNAFNKMKYRSDAVGCIIVNRDFNLKTMDTNLLTGLNALEVSNNITKRLLLEALKKHEIVDIVDIDEVLDELEQNGINMNPVIEDEL